MRASSLSSSGRPTLSGIGAKRLPGLLSAARVAAGDRLQLTFGFRCELCAEHYTLTVASHDPDGVWHDWLEDAVAFSVADSRYTAGVANLRATVSFTRPE